MSTLSLAALICLTMAVSAVFPQSSEMFEVASIKLTDPLNPATSFHFEPGASVRIEGASLKSLVLFAYDLREFQLSGATGWMLSERYGILAKGAIAEGPADYGQMKDGHQKAKATLIRKRMQALLAERFRLVVRRETKDLPTYALVVAKNGLKMQPNTEPDGSPPSTTIGRTLFKAQRASLEEIAQGLASIIGRPVRDETGLKDFYDFKLQWMPDRVPSGGTEERPFETSGPTLFTALQEQLGLNLKLVSKKGPVEILVIDRAERPSEN